jgi:hypothetical protein
MNGTVNVGFPRQNVPTLPICKRPYLSKRRGLDILVDRSMAGAFSRPNVLPVLDAADVALCYISRSSISLVSGVVSGFDRVRQQRKSWAAEGGTQRRERHP